MRTSAPSDEDFEALRSLMFSIAYRMLGSVAAAEDVLQDAYLRYHNARSGGAAIDSPKAYLSAVVTRLAIDELQSARAEREHYVGEWLPEPLLTDEGPGDPADLAAQSDSLSMAFLLLLERLNPVERAVLLLHDVFGYEFAEVARIIDRSVANCRQIARRARHAIEADRPRFSTSNAERERLADRFFAAVSAGEVDELVELLAADAVVYGDGGGKAPQWMTPILGVERAARVLAGVGGRVRDIGGHLERRQVNGQPGALVLDADGHLINVFVLDVDSTVRTIRSVINPDKLSHLGQLSDLTALRRTSRTSARRSSEPSGTDAP